MTTTIEEIADGIYRIATATEAVPGGFTFNQFLVDDDEPLLFHCGLRHGFDDVAAAVARVRPVSDLRYVSFGHWEADEAGAMNRWLAAAPDAVVAIGALGGMLSAGDQADGTVRSLADGETLSLGAKRVRWIDTPHVPHGWDAGLLFEETTGTLFCGDLLSQNGVGPAVVGDDVVGPALAAEDQFGSTALTPTTGPTIAALAALAPTTLAIMHGSAFTGDGGAALAALGAAYEERLRAAMR